MQASKSSHCKKVRSLLAVLDQILKYNFHYLNHLKNDVFKTFYYSHNIVIMNLL